MQAPKRKQHLQKNKLEDDVNREPVVQNQTTSTEKVLSHKETITKVNLRESQDHTSLFTKDSKKKEREKNEEKHQHRYNLRRRI